MVDYVKSIGQYPGSYMMIRDLGTTVEFWLKANSIATWTQNMPYGWTVNGSTGSGTHSYNYPWPGGGWPTPGPLERLRSFNVATTQTVTFRLGRTYTQAFGGPHTFSVHLQRHSIRVRHNGTWRQGIPYVKHGGQWRLGQAYSRHNGSWRVGG